ncbi:hypothetical protein EDB84DRAFT_1564985 [Lactarius hengduanensis]|nr:hypothetical protein EDB84DRAFT_1564985 [Lactarius hengduanensis]
MRKDEGRSRTRTSTCDVVLENLKPGSTRTPPDPSPYFADLNIATRVSTGEMGSRSRQATVCDAEAGFRFINGFPDGKTGERSGPPVRPNISLGDSVAGLTAAFGTVHDVPRKIPASPKERQWIMVNLMEGIIPEFDRKGVVRSPSGSSVTGIVPTGAYPCTPAPGSPPDYVITGANADAHDRSWRPDGSSVREEPRGELRSRTRLWPGRASRTRDDVLRALDQIGVPAGRVASVRERGAVEPVWVPGQAHSTADESG